MEFDIALKTFSIQKILLESNKSIMYNGLFESIMVVYMMYRIQKITKKTYGFKLTNLVR